MDSLKFLPSCFQVSDEQTSSSVNLDISQVLILPRPKVSTCFKIERNILDGLSQSQVKQFSNRSRKIIFFLALESQAETNRWESDNTHTKYLNENLDSVGSE